MTREHRLVLSLDEIHAIRWACQTCGSAVSYPLDSAIRLPPTCHACHAAFVESPSVADWQQLQAFVDALTRVRPAHALGATLTLELLDPPDV